MARKFIMNYEAEPNLFAMFQKSALQFHDRVAQVWIDESGNEAKRWTYADFLGRIRAVAYYLSDKLCISRGDRVILCYPPGLDFFVGFWACLSLGVIAVPVCPTDPFVEGVSDVSAKFEAIV